LDRNVDDFLAELASKLARAATKPNVHSYIPNSEIHKGFHESNKVGRILRGGNRSGKSVAGTVESVWRATGRHPFQKTHDVPTRGRIVTVDVEAGVNQIVLPLLSQWIPPSELTNSSWEDSYSKQKKLVTLRNGSTIEIKTHQQDLDSFAGVPLHFCWFDEECPQAIFQECRLRLIDYNGCWYMTMTPVEGQDWIFDRFIVTHNKNVQMFEVDIRDNPHLNQEALALLEEDLTDDEKQVRQHGVFIPRGGLILDKFNYNRHVVDGGRRIPDSWALYCSIDHGFNNPTAVLWHAVAPDKRVVTFREHYMRRWVITKHVKRIREINAEIGREPFMYVGDPSMIQKTGETGTSPLQIYRENGIPLMQSRRDVKGRNDKMNEYFERDMWTITRDCPNLIREVRGYSFKIFSSPKIADRNNLREEPSKKNDHAVDASGYFFNFMPHLGPKKVSEFDRLSRTLTQREDFPWEVDAGFYNSNPDDYAFGEVP